MLPKLYQDLEDTENWKGCRIIEHSVLDARTLQVCCALAYRDAVEFRYNTCLLVPDIDEIKIQFSKWNIKYLTQLRTKKITIIAATTGKRSHSAKIYLCSDPTQNFTDIQTFYIDGAERFKRKPELLKSEKSSFLRSLVAGQLTESPHWFYELSRKTPSKAQVLTRIRIDAETTLQHFPSQTTPGLAIDDPYYKRKMLLHDVEPTFSTKSFISFARNRLKIRSDKPLELLSEDQKLDCKDVYGTPIIRLDITKLQRKYLAIKRLTRIQGKKPWYILLKYRRGGFTTLEQGMSYFLCTSTPGAYCTTLAHTRGATRRIFRMVNLYRERDPQCIVEGDSQQELNFTNGSYFFIGTAGGTGFGRGDTLQRVHGSEVSKWMEDRANRIELVEDLIAALLGAASHGEVILESTPNGKEWFHKAYNEAKDGINDFSPIFLPWFIDPINSAKIGSYNPEEVIETLSDEEKFLIDSHELSINQIAFRRQEKKKYGKLFPQEMPEDDVSCFISSGICYFDTEKLVEILNSIPEGAPIHRRGGVEHIWKDPVPGVEYVIGVDTSEGLAGSDMNGLGVLSRDTGEQVAALHGLFSPPELAEHVKRFAEIYNNALVGVERENHGHAVLLRLRELYSGSIYSFRKDRVGWSTNAETRPIMLSALAEAVEEGYMKVHDRSFINECLSFRKQTSGKFEADTGAYDDRVMKWAIAWQMRESRANIMSVGTY